MYNKLKELNITNRIVNEDNDYLLKEEYEKLKNIGKEDADVNRLLEIIELYKKDKTNREYDWFSIKSINVVRPSEYSVSSNNSITFCLELYKTKHNRLNYVDSLDFRETGFKQTFIHEMYDLLSSLVETYKDTITEQSSRYSDYAHFIFNKEFNQEYRNKTVLRKNAQELMDYFKDKIVVIDEDSRIVDELKEIDDFLNDL